ncbi:LuxR C-terminal-related transcriptional regulator [Seohaeicola saemankumensis]|uniref:helix-turn-helix transcriptional regulator n=1 Tax=Seohaeicola saemankumensis TaxID=481181 RepID=UPI0035D0D58E
MRALNLRTADWCFENGRLTSAIRHALDAKQPDKAVELVLRAGAVQIGMQQGAPRLAACLDQIPMQLVNQTPRLAIARAYLLLKSARLDEAARHLDELRQTIDPADEEIRRELVLVDAHKRLYEDRHLTKEQLAALEHTARITPVSDELMRGIFTNFLCHFQIQAGNLEKARAYGDAAMAIFTDLKIAHLQFFMHLHLSVVDLDCGEFSAAYGRRSEALRLAKSHFRHDPAICALADIYSCEIALEMGKTDGLEKRLTHALEQAGRAEGWSEAYLAGYETSLILSFANHGYDTAILRIADAEASATRRASRRFARHLRILELELALDAGNDIEAGRLAAQVETMLNVQDHDNKLRWRGRVLARLALVRHFIASDANERAMTILADVTDDCQRLGLKRYLLRTEVLGVIAASGVADWGLADRSLKSVLALASPEFPGALIRHAKAFSQAARECVLSNGLASYTQDDTRKLAQLLWACSGYDASGARTLLSELLTNREYAVVELIARGDSNKVIARELDLSEATVKFHIKNVFSKLNVNSRKLVAEIASVHGVNVAPTPKGA